MGTTHGCPLPYLRDSAWQPFRRKMAAQRVVALVAGKSFSLGTGVAASVAKRSCCSMAGRDAVAVDGLVQPPLAVCGAMAYAPSSRVIPGVPGGPQFLVDVSLPIPFVESEVVGDLGGFVGDGGECIWQRSQRTWRRCWLNAAP